MGIMAHYAFLDKNNIVTEVIIGVDETELIEGLEPEIWYGNLHNKVCKRTSYNANIRGIYASIGCAYNQEEDIFILPQPFPSWIREGSSWKPPISRPLDENKYVWNEELLSWDKIQNI
jgi:hypothetical protein